MKILNSISQLHTMYPCHSWMLVDQTFKIPVWAKHCSLYGYSFGQSRLTVDGKNHQLSGRQYFAFNVAESATLKAVDKLFVVLRLGYKVPNQIGWIEERGRLSYIDGCSDSLLVYPSRLGDSSLSLLYFPPGIEQTFHRHPSIRLGCVVSGSGSSDHGEVGNQTEDSLVAGLSFCLEEQERHRFKTLTDSMTIIAFHPDGDWGPTDGNHSMLNRTYIIK